MINGNIDWMKEPTHNRCAIIRPKVTKMWLYRNAIYKRECVTVVKRCTIIKTNSYCICNLSIYFQISVLAFLPLSSSFFVLVMHIQFPSESPLNPLNKKIKGSTFGERYFTNRDRPLFVAKQDVNVTRVSWAIRLESGEGITPWVFPFNSGTTDILSTSELSFVAHPFPHYFWLIGGSFVGSEVLSMSRID